MQKYRLVYSTEEKNHNDNTPKPKRVRNQRVIDRMFDREQIDFDQYNAACKFYSQYYLANYFKMLKSKPIVEISQKTNYYNQLEGVLNARQSYEKARSELPKEELEVLDWVVIRDSFLKYCPRAKNAQQILCSGLDVLVKYYGFNK